MTPKLWPINLGLGGGAVAAYVSYLACLHLFDNPSRTLLAVVASICGAIGCFFAYKFTRVLTVIATSAFGAFLFISGVDVLTERQLTVHRVEVMTN